MYSNQPSYPSRGIVLNSKCVSPFPPLIILCGSGLVTVETLLLCTIILSYMYTTVTTHIIEPPQLRNRIFQTIMGNYLPPAPVPASVLK